MRKGRSKSINPRITVSTVGPRPQGPGEDPDIHWSQEAACLGADTDLFYFDGTDNPARAHRLIDLYCSRCPVRAPCLSESNDYDLYYVLRGGRLPGKLKKSGRPGRPEVFVQLGEFCEEGHDKWAKRTDGGSTRYYCHTCDADRRAQAREARSRAYELLSDEEKAALKAAFERKSAMTACSKGHVDWAIKLRGGKYMRSCRTCRRAFDKGRKRDGAKLAS